MNKDKKMLFGIGIVFLFLATVSFTYAYFTATIVNKDVKDQVVQTGTLELTYTDGPEIIMNNIKPGATITKEVSVKNTGTLNTSYNLVWQELANGMGRNDMVMEITCTRMNGDIEEGTCEGLEETPIKIKRIKKNISIEDGITHKYIFKITLKETNANQNYNQDKSFTGVLGIEEYKENDAKPIYCTTDTELTKGAIYTNGQYGYMYQQGYFLPKMKDNVRVDLNYDGWSVFLNDYDSTDPITDDVCTYINGKPVVSAYSLYNYSSASSIDLSSLSYNELTDMSEMFEFSDATFFDVSKLYTGKVTNMSKMFWGSSTNKIDLSNFDTSNVTDMSQMFDDISVDNLDFSNFDTSNVVNMNSMFTATKINSLDLSSFNTSKVTGMNYMFTDTENVSNLDLSSFDTSSVTGMAYMFGQTMINNVDLSSFDTSKVTNMYMMFYNTSVNVDLTVIDTSSVTNMSNMFYKSKYYSLNLSSFDTSNVTDMTSMFEECPYLGTIYASDKFNMNSVTRYSRMFSNSTRLVGGAGTKYDSSHVDKEYARIDGGTELPGYFTLKN